jgi:pyruvate/2-oxoglutarate dehydrogenase complex dihydrolipoamide dehydrogenase (E3) component
MTEIVKSSNIQNFDVVILGGGRGGMNLAATLSAAGKKCLVIERQSRMIGGSCVNIACIPTKTFVTGARMFASTKQAKRYGITGCEPVLDWLELRSYVEGISHQYHEFNHSILKDTNNLSYVIGQGRFISDKTIEVDCEGSGKQVVHGDIVVINTGTRPLIPKLPGIENALTSETIQRMDVLPKQLVVVGAGFVGIELAQLFAMLGSSVTLINSNSAFLSDEDGDVRALLQETFTQADIRIANSAKLTAIDAQNNQKVVELSTEGNLEKVVADAVLIAVGRVPNTDVLDAEKTGVELNAKGFVNVGQKLETTCDGIYAIGDVNGGPQFTHVSYDDFRIVTDQIIGKKMKSTANRLIPFTLFTTPEISRVGLNERQAKEASLGVEVLTFPLGMMPWAKMRGNDKGFLKILIDKQSGKLVGTTVVTTDSAELMGIAQTAMTCGAHYEVLRDLIFSHPTMAEAYNFLLRGATT